MAAAEALDVTLHLFVALVVVVVVVVASVAVVAVAAICTAFVRFYLAGPCYSYAM